MLKIFEEFDPRANPVDGNYPFGSIKNESVPGAKDGTPLDKNWGNDYVGFDAALLAAAGTSPTGNPDTVLLSDRLIALNIHTANRYERFMMSTTAKNLPATDIRVGMQIRFADRGDALFEVVTGETADTFSIVAHDTLAFQFKLRRALTTTLQHLGAVGSGDETTVIQALLDLGGNISVGKGTFTHKETLTFNQTLSTQWSGLGVTSGSEIKFVPTTPGDPAFDFVSLDHWSIENILFTGPGRATGTLEVCFNMASSPDASEFQWYIKGCKFEDWNKAGILLSAQWQGRIDTCYFQKCGDTITTPGLDIPDTGGIVFQESISTSGWAGSGNDIANCYFVSCSYGVYNDKGWNVVLTNPIYESCTFPFFKSAAGTAMIIFGGWEEDFGNPTDFKPAKIEGEVIQLGGRSTTGADNPKYRQFSNVSVLSRSVAFAGTQDCEVELETTRFNVSDASSIFWIKTQDATAVLTRRWGVDRDGDFVPNVDATYNIGNLTEKPAQIFSGEYRIGSTNVRWVVVTGSPEGAVAAPVGTIASRDDGGAVTSFYVKETGTGNTGWVAK